MPTYEYICNACNHEFERFHSITAKPVRICPQCKQRKVVRLIGGGAGVIFKGSGFYETDYRSESYKNAAKAESDGSGKKQDAKSKSNDKSTPGKSTGSSDKSGAQ